jgi:glycosyltransferase involved in cell wall biosynthesis
MESSVTAREWPPKISVVTPSFNQVRFLEQAIMSVLAQGYPNLEYIVIDGGSADGSADIIRRHAARFAYWQSAPDRGQSDALNIGLQRATGALLAVVNSDDKLVEGSLWAMAYLARAHPECAVFFGANHIFFEPDGGIIYQCPRPWKIGGVSGFQQEATFWRRSVHDNLGWFNVGYQFGMWHDFFSRALLTQRCLFHSEPMSIIRNHPHTKTSTLGNVAQADLRQIAKDYGGVRLPLRWRLRARMLGLLAGATAYLGRRWLRARWRLAMPPAASTPQGPSRL